MTHHPKALIAGIAVASAIALAGCGGAAKLNDDDAMRVADADVALATYAYNFVSGKPTNPGAESHAIDTLIAMYRKHPTAIYPAGHETMRQVLLDDARSLEYGDPSAASDLRAEVGSS